MLELVLATLENVKHLVGFGFGAAAFFCLISWAMIAGASFSDRDERNAQEAKQRFFKVIKWAPILVITIIPSINDLWEIRISLIKYQLASPQNVQKGAEEIGRIAKKLECKYLGCDNETPKEGK